MAKKIISIENTKIKDYIYVKYSLGYTELLHAKEQYKVEEETEVKNLTSNYKMAFDYVT